MVSDGLLILAVIVGIMLVFILMGSCNDLRCRKIPQVKRPWRLNPSGASESGGLNR